MNMQPPGADLPISELLHQLSDQTVALVRQELDLARVELAQKGKVAGESAGFFAATSLFGIGAFGALTIMLIAALAYIVALWAAALIVAIIYGIVAAITAARGRASLKKITSPIPKHAAHSVREDVTAVRQAVQQGR